MTSFVSCPRLVPGQRVCIVRPIIRSKFYAATAIGEMAVTIDFERPEQSDGRTCGGQTEDLPARALVLLCMTDAWVRDQALEIALSKQS